MQIDRTVFQRGRKKGFGKTLIKILYKYEYGFKSNCIKSVMSLLFSVTSIVFDFFVCLPGVDFEPAFCHCSPFGGGRLTIFSILERYRPKFVFEYNRNQYRINMSTTGTLVLRRQIYMNGIFLLTFKYLLFCTFLFFLCLIG